MRLSFFCISYGAKHNEMMLNVMLPSLLQSGNIPYLVQGKHQLDFDFHSVNGAEPEHIRAGAALERLGIKPHFHKIPLEKWNRSGKPSSPSEVAYPALLQQIDLCLRRGSIMIFSPPDTYFGNGSIAGLLLCQQTELTSVAAVHVRVLDSAFREKIEGRQQISNADLVTTSLKTLHPVWAMSQSGLPVNNSASSGHSITNVGGGLYLIRHCLPTPYLAAFRRSDLDWFLRHADFHFWDWTWPAELIRQRRYAVAGSSEIFFAAELTAAAMNNQALGDTSARFSDLGAHFAVNESFVISARATESIDLRALYRPVIEQQLSLVYRPSSETKGTKIEASTHE